jgi:hypothetical protein
MCVVWENWNILVRTIDPTDELIDSLSNHILSEADIASIESRADTESKNTRLLRLMRRQEPEVIERFIEVLQALDQPHAAGLINGRPLPGKTHMSDEHYKLLSEKFHDVCNYLIPFGNFLGQLMQAGVFQSARQKTRRKHTRTGWKGGRSDGDNNA